MKVIYRAVLFAKRARGLSCWPSICNRQASEKQLGHTTLAFSSKGSAW